MHNTHNRNAITRIALAVSAAALLPLSASAAPLPPQPAQLHGPAQAQGPQHAALTVSYYAGNPAQGGRLLKTVTLPQPPRPDQAGPNAGKPEGNAPRPPRPDAQRPGAERPGAKRPGERGHHRHGPLGLIKAQAPAGATFAVVKGEGGKTRVIDLNQAGMGQAAPGRPLPGQPAQPGQPPRR